MFRISRAGTRRAFASLCLVAQFVVLAGLGACGGGGGSDSGGGTTVGALHITPSTLSAQQVQGESTSFVVVATVTGTLPSVLYVRIVDAQGLTTGSIGSGAPQGNQYSYAISTNPALPEGTNQGSIVVQFYTDAAMTVPYASGSVTLPATVTVAPRHTVQRMWVDHRAVALSSAPGDDRLTQTLRVQDVLGSVAWAASSDQSWLHVTASGHTSQADDTITLVADPTGLSTDRLHTANVTIHATDGSVDTQETVRVGLWVASTAPAARALSAAYTMAASDPVAPLAYAYLTGADTPGIDVINLYTGAVVGHLAISAGEAPRDMQVSGDGLRLYVFRSSVSSATYTLDVFDTAALTHVATFAVPTGWNARAVRDVRVHGVELLIFDDNEVLSPADGSPLPLDALALGGQSNTSPLTAATPDGNHYLTLDGPVSPAHLYIMHTDIVDADGGRLAFPDSVGASGTNWASGLGLVSAWDSMSVYASVGTDPIARVDVATGAVTYFADTDSAAGALELDPFGRVFSYRAGFLTSYSSSGTQLQRIQLPTNASFDSGLIRAAGDGRMVVWVDGTHPAQVLIP